MTCTIEQVDDTIRRSAVAFTTEPMAVEQAQCAVSALYEEHQDAGTNVFTVAAIAMLRGRLPDEQGTIEVRDFVRTLPPSVARERAIDAIGVLIEVRIRDAYESDPEAYDAE